MDLVCCLCYILCPPPKKKVYEAEETKEPVIKTEKSPLLNALSICSPPSAADLGMSFDESYSDGFDMNMKRKSGSPGTYVPDFQPFVPPTPQVNTGLADHFNFQNGSHASEDGVMSPSSRDSHEGTYPEGVFGVRSPTTEEINKYYGDGDVSDGSGREEVFPKIERRRVEVT